jgi:hypothetical protein
MSKPVLVPDVFWTSLRVYVVPIMGLMAVLLAYLLATRGGLFGPAFTVAEIVAEMAVLVVLTIVFLGAMEAREFRVADDGVSFRRFSQRIDVYWDLLQPNFATAAPDRLPLRFTSLQSRLLGPNVLLTRDQARALLAHPEAARWEVPAALRQAWNLDADRPPG